MNCNCTLQKSCFLHEVEDYDTRYNREFPILPEPEIVEWKRTQRDSYEDPYMYSPTFFQDAQEA